MHLVLLSIIHPLKAQWCATQHYNWGDPRVNNKSEISAMWL